MLIQKENIENLVVEIENFANRKFINRKEIISLIENLNLPGEGDNIDEIIFLGKFLHNTSNIMKRIGPTGEGFDKLSSEFQKNLENIIIRFKIFLNKFDGKARTEFEEKFLIQSPQNFNILLSFFEDLSWLKNFEIDKKQKIRSLL